MTRPAHKAAQPPPKPEVRVIVPPKNDPAALSKILDILAAMIRRHEGR